MKKSTERELLIDRKKLRMQMIDKDINKQQLAAKLGITYACLTSKIRAEAIFTESEIVELIKCLGNGIFFIGKV